MFQHCERDVRKTNRQRRTVRADEHDRLRPERFKELFHPQAKSRDWLRPEFVVAVRLLREELATRGFGGRVSQHTPRSRRTKSLDQIRQEASIERGGSSIADRRREPSLHATRFRILHEHAERCHAGGVPSIKRRNSITETCPLKRTLPSNSTTGTSMSNRFCKAGSVSMSIS